MSDDFNNLHERPPTTTGMFFRFIRTRFLSIVFVLSGTVALGGFLWWDGNIPRWARLAGITMILIAPFGYIVGSSITSMFPDPPGVVLVDMDARKMDGAVYWMPIEDFHELDVTDGQLNQVAPSLYFGKKVDLEQMTACGTWRGTLSDRQLLRGLQKVYECRGQLEEDAKKGFILETQAFTIVRSAVRDATRTVVDTFQKGTLPDDGDSINGAIDDALERYNLENKIEDELEDIDDSDLPDDLLDPDDDLEGQADHTERVDGSATSDAPKAEVNADDD